MAHLWNLITPPYGAADITVILGFLGTIGRIGKWILDAKIRKKAVQAPVLGWVGRRIAIESTAITLAIRLAAVEAENRQLREDIRKAGITPSLHLADSSDGSSGAETSLLNDSKKTEGTPPESTLASLADSPT